MWEAVETLPSVPLLAICHQGPCRQLSCQHRVRRPRSSWVMAPPIIANRLHTKVGDGAVAEAGGAHQPKEAKLPLPFAQSCPGPKASTQDRILCRTAHITTVRPNDLPVGRSRGRAKSTTYLACRIAPNSTRDSLVFCVELRVPCRQHINRVTRDRDSIHPHRRLTWPYLGGREEKVLQGRGAAQQPQPGRSPGSRSPSANRTSGPGASYIRARVTASPRPMEWPGDANGNRWSRRPETPPLVIIWP